MKPQIEAGNDQGLKAIQIKVMKIYFISKLDWSYHCVVIRVRSDSAIADW